MSAAILPLFPQFHEGMVVTDRTIGTGRVFRVNKTSIRVRLMVEPSPFPFPVAIERSYTNREAKLRLRAGE
jgi:hypothetical protein